MRYGQRWYKKKEFDSEPVINKNVLKTKIKSHGKKVTDFHDKEILKVDSNHTYLAAISFDSALMKYENYQSGVNTLRKR